MSNQDNLEDYDYDRYDRYAHYTPDVRHYRERANPMDEYRFVYHILYTFKVTL